MASSYNFSENPLKDVMIIEILNDKYEKEIDLHAIIIEKCVELIKRAYESINISNYSQYIDFEFDIDKDQKYIKVICNNIVCALWFCGIFPTNCKDVFIRNNFKARNINYIFENKCLKKVK